MKFRIASVFGSTIITIIMLFFSVGGSAQTSKGSIAGTVTDPAGASVPNATITARGLENGETRTVVSNVYGEYRITAILPGIYDLKVTSQGFALLVVDHVDVKASVDTPLDFQLQVSGASQSVMVEATGSAVQSESAELSANISSTEVKELPIRFFEPNIASVN
jgi:hypothetical protein